MDEIKINDESVQNIVKALSSGLDSVFSNSMYGAVYNALNDRDEHIEMTKQQKSVTGDKQNTDTFLSRMDNETALSDVLVALSEKVGAFGEKVDAFDPNNTSSIQEPPSSQRQFFNQSDNGNVPPPNDNSDAIKSIVDNSKESGQNSVAVLQQMLGIMQSWNQQRLETMNWEMRSYKPYYQKMNQMIDDGKFDDLMKDSTFTPGGDGGFGGGGLWSTLGKTLLALAGGAVGLVSGLLSGALESYGSAWKKIFKTIGEVLDGNKPSGIIHDNAPKGGDGNKPNKASEPDKVNKTSEPSKSSIAETAKKAEKATETAVSDATKATEKSAKSVSKAAEGVEKVASDVEKVAESASKVAESASKNVNAVEKVAETAKKIADAPIDDVARAGLKHPPGFGVLKDLPVSPDVPTIDLPDVPVSLMKQEDFLKYMSMADKYGNKWKNVGKFRKALIVGNEIGRTVGYAAQYIDMALELANGVYRTGKFAANEKAYAGDVVNSAAATAEDIVFAKYGLNQIAGAVGGAVTGYERSEVADDYKKLGALMLFDQQEAAEHGNVLYSPTEFDAIKNIHQWGDDNTGVLPFLGAMVDAGIFADSPSLGEQFQASSVFADGRKNTEFQKYVKEKMERSGAAGNAGMQAMMDKLFSNGLSEAHRDLLFSYSEGNLYFDEEKAKKALKAFQDYKVASEVDTKYRTHRQDFFTLMEHPEYAGADDRGMIYPVGKIDGLDGLIVADPSKLGDIGDYHDPRMPDIGLPDDISKYISGASGLHYGDAIVHSDVADTTAPARLFAGIDPNIKVIPVNPDGRMLDFRSRYDAVSDLGFFKAYARETDNDKRMEMLIEAMGEKFAQQHKAAMDDLASKIVTHFMGDVRH